MRSRLFTLQKAQARSPCKRNEQKDIDKHGRVPFDNLFAHACDWPSWEVLLSIESIMSHAKVLLRFNLLEQEES